MERKKRWLIVGKLRPAAARARAALPLVARSLAVALLAALAVAEEEALLKWSASCLNSR